MGRCVEVPTASPHGALTQLLGPAPQWCNGCMLWSVVRSARSGAIREMEAMKKMQPALVLAAALAAAIGACDRSGVRSERSAEPSEPATKVPERRPEAVMTAGHPGVVDGIAHARCAREQRCGNVGQDEKWLTLESCIRRIKADWRDELNAFECPGGIDERELEECMEEIRNEDCASPVDTLGRIVACRSGDICRATP